MLSLTAVAEFKASEVSQLHLQSGNVSDVKGSVKMFPYRSPGRRIPIAMNSNEEARRARSDKIMFLRAWRAMWLGDCMDGYARRGMTEVMDKLRCS